MNGSHSLSVKAKLNLGLLASAVLKRLLQPYESTVLYNLGLIILGYSMENDKLTGNLTCAPDTT